MPELPEVEILVRHLDPLLRGRTVHSVTVHRPNVIRPDTAGLLTARLIGSRFEGVHRRAKFLIFQITSARRESFQLLGHLGMTGRMYLLPASEPPPKHAVVSLNLGTDTFVYEDVRSFGRLTTNLCSLDTLGPEPLDDDFHLEQFAEQLKRSRQAIKVKLLDQSLVAGIGNIYASEILFHCGIAPRRKCHQLTAAQVLALHRAIRSVLSGAIERGSTLPLNFSGDGSIDRLFYFGRGPGDTRQAAENLRVYDREDEACTRCGAPIKRIVQAARSTYFCRVCQRN